MKTVHDLSKKIVLITGAGSGIGRAAAQMFASGGAKISAVDRNEDKLKVLRQDIGQEHSFLCMDVADQKNPKAVEETLKRFDRLDVVVNSAGVSHFRSIAKIDPSEWDEMFRTNVQALFYLSVAAAEAMDHGGCILNISSNAAHKGRAMAAHYSASKAAVINLSQSIALAYGKKGIRCNTVCPAVVNTPMWDSLLPELQEITGQEGSTWMNRFREMTPLGKLATPEDVANLLCFLASDQAQIITGQAVTICGGFSLTC